MMFGLKPSCVIERYAPALKDGVSTYCTITRLLRLKSITPAFMPGVKKA